LKILLIGKTGQLGSALLEDLTIAGYDVFSPLKNRLDITNKKSIFKHFKNHSPDLVINTAAYHNLHLCEENPFKAFRTNFIAVKNLAEISSHFNSVLVSISTDYVFDGKKKKPYSENDAPNPLQIYGLSKLAGEYAALSYQNSIIIRTSGLYGLQGATSKGGNFVDKRIKDAKKHTHLKISHDQTVSPTFALDLSRAVLKIISHPRKSGGIYHLVNEGFCTWYEFTKEIYNIMNINIQLDPIDRKGIDGGMRRPQFTALENNNAANLGITLPTWKNGLIRYLNIMYMNMN